MTKIFVFWLLLPILIFAENHVINYGYKVVNIYPHDENAFTQGLVIENGIFYESTGKYGFSTLRKVDLESGGVLEFRNIDENFFAEGITIWEDKIIQLTWRSRTGFVQDKESFMTIDEFYYPTEGWGITNDGESLIMSVGNDSLYFLDPETFEKIKVVKVTGETDITLRLNELEFVKGKIFANVWPSDKIVVIDPETGKITAWIDLSGLMPNRSFDYDAVLNGIAWDADAQRLFVTGKMWPNLFEIELIPLK